MSETPRNCQICGEKLASSVKRCPYCGAKRKIQDEEYKIPWGLMVITLIICAIMIVVMIGTNDGNNKASKYKECSMCGDRVPEDDMRGKWCKDCQNDAFGDDGWYNKIK